MQAVILEDRPDCNADKDCSEGVLPSQDSANLLRLYDTHPLVVRQGLELAGFTDGSPVSRLAGTESIPESIRRKESRYEV